MGRAGKWTVLAIGCMKGDSLVRLSRDDHLFECTLSPYTLGCNISANLQTPYTLKGDVEDQRHNPNWFVDRKHMLRSNQEEVLNKLGYFILKVPKYRRQPPLAFSPHEWQFGLHNRENLDNSGSEAIKLAIAVQYGLVGEKWVQFCDAIVDDPKAMLVCYGLPNGVTSWTDEQIKQVLALDALFLATYIDIQFPENERRLWTPNALRSCFNTSNMFDARYGIWMQIVRVDLYRVENQIPSVLIDKVVEYISNFVASLTSKGIEHLIGDLQYQQRSEEYAVYSLASSFMITSGEAFKIDNSQPFGEKTHILGAAYKIICGSKGLLIKRSMERSVYIHVPSATELKQSGIKLVGVDGPLCTMSYDKKCLCIPKVKLYDDTISFIRNMAWYEGCTILNGCLFNNYIVFMTDLIQAPEDLDLLIKSGVIYNACGIKAFEMWRSLDEGLIQISSSKTHHDMKEAIVRRCHLRRYRLWSEFKIIFCSKPWVVLSTIAVVLVTMATLVQTYIAIIGSNKMKPKFP